MPFARIACFARGGRFPDFYVALVDVALAVMLPTLSGERCAFRYRVTL